jgi:Secretion system C-terminal sorting domain/Metallo-peptidase family M12B Reprolysin-like
VLFSFSIISLSAQTNLNLFKVIKPPTNLSQDQKEMIAKIEKYPNVQNVTYVKINDYSTFIKDGHVSFNIPNSLKTAKAKIKKRERTKDGGYNFYGIMGSQSEGYLGDLQLIKENGLVFGTMSFENKSYRIYGIDKNTSAILSFDKRSVNRSCENDNSTEPIIKPRESTLEPNRINTCQEPRIRTLCLFTTRARDFDPSIAQTANASVNQFNNALFNSGVTITEAQMVLSDVRLLPNFTEVSFNIRGDIDRLTINATANQFRNETASDMVILFTDGNYGGDNIEGTVANGAIPAENPSSYAIVEAETAVIGPAFTFIHEIGHLFGGRHNDDPGGPSYSHGSFFTINFSGIFNINCVDVMHNILPNTFSLPIYSNPNVSVFGTPTGNANCCNVARRITETASNIASFRASPNILTTNILGQNSINSFGSYFYEPDITCGNGPYTTTWEVSYNNQSFTQVVANDGQLQLNISPGSAAIFGSSVDIRMTVTSSDGQSSTSFLTVFIDVFGSPLLRKPKSSIDSKSLFNLYPNPADFKINLDYTLEENTDVDIKIFDTQGREVKSLKFPNQFKGYNQHILDVSVLSMGLYLCQIKTTTSTMTKKLFINHSN